MLPSALPPAFGAAEAGASVGGGGGGGGGVSCADASVDVTIDATSIRTFDGRLDQIVKGDGIGEIGLIGSGGPSAAFRRLHDGRQTCR